ncbi:MAG: hypothetical protein B7Y39_00935 [Bdellovibrio sp. 28-41-41]|nr:MAG: hypothetical protein B7Y39_00935 [Bdellovibrio sp. 28-41-41]
MRELRTTFRHYKKKFTRAAACFFSFRRGAVIGAELRLVYLRAEVDLLQFSNAASYFFCVSAISFISQFLFLHFICFGLYGPPSGVRVVLVLAMLDAIVSIFIRMDFSDGHRSAIANVFIDRSRVDKIIRFLMRPSVLLFYQFLCRFTL